MAFQTPYPDPFEQPENSNFLPAPTGATAAETRLHSTREYLSQLLDSDLPSTEVRLMTKIWLTANDLQSDIVEFSLLELASVAKVSATTVSDLTNHLSAAGWLEKKQMGGGRKMQYRLLAPHAINIMCYLSLEEAGGAQIFDFQENVNPALGLRSAKSESLGSGKSVGSAQKTAFSAPPLSPGPPIPLGNSYIAPTPSAQIQPAELSDELLVVVQKIITFGVTASVVPDLVRRLPRRCETWSRALPFLPSNLTNPGGWLRKAIEGDFALPKRFLETEARAARQAEKFGDRIAAPTAQQLAQQAEIENAKFLAALPSSQRYVIELQVDEKLSTGIFTHMPPKIKNSIRDGMILEAARQASFAGGAVA
jgi:hypothetical protein